jgi:hypothetical protein
VSALWRELVDATEYSQYLRRQQKDLKRHLLVTLGKVEDLRGRWADDRCRCSLAMQAGASANPIEVSDEEELEEVRPPLVCLATLGSSESY